MLIVSSSNEVLFVISRLLLWELDFRIERRQSRYEIRVNDFGDVRSTAAVTAIYNELAAATAAHRPLTH